MANTRFSDIFKNQITQLIIEIDPSKNEIWIMESICNLIFSKVTHLTFYKTSYEDLVRLFFDLPSGKLSSSTLTALNIQVRTFYVELTRIFQLNEPISEPKKIPNLKFFSLSCLLEVYNYDELVLPLLYRMTNLEEHRLYLSIDVVQRFIDGNNLKETILHNISSLNQFSFHICSTLFINNQMNLSSNQDIQETFIDFQKNQIISYIDYFPQRNQGQYHIRSYPFLMKFYHDITNHFLGGIYIYMFV
ncbi:hypothetical protein I4U23_027694 [Adineta vaga]|nr:hypothetical protein I4U23_027694 [Adineta vaga]